MVVTKLAYKRMTGPLYISVVESSIFCCETMVTEGFCPPPGNIVTFTGVRSRQSSKSEQPRTRRLILYCPKADTYRIQVKFTWSISQQSVHIDRQNKDCLSSPRNICVCVFFGPCACMSRIQQVWCKA